MLLNKGYPQAVNDNHINTYLYTRHQLINGKANKLETASLPVFAYLSFEKHYSK